ncbi:hypothetical protein [Nocardia thraciensis]
MDAYGFFIAGFLITMGTLGDRIARRRLWSGDGLCTALLLGDRAPDRDRIRAALSRALPGGGA